MDSIEQYNFLLQYTENIRISQYLEIKANIENVCTFTLQQAKKYHLNDFAIAIQLHKQLFMSVYYNNKQISFGLYDKSQKQIILTAPDVWFKNLKNIDFIDFIKRIENQTMAMSKGKIFNVDRLAKSWEKALSRQISHSEPDEERF